MVHYIYDSVQTIPSRTPPTHVRRRSRQSDMVNSPALSQKQQQKKRDSKQTPSFLKTAREKLTRALSLGKKAGSWNIRPHTTCDDTNSALPSFIQKQNSTSPTSIIDHVPAIRREASPCAGSSSEPPPSEINVNQNLFGATSVEEGDPAIISVQSAIKILILKEVHTGKAVEIMKRVKAEKHGASAVIAMNYSLPDQTKERLVQHFLPIPKCNTLREGEKTKL